ncbi:NADPH-dependent pterin aldehyde reductase [Vitis vinifera]|uniref:NADPH-dependent pterin aldehyde reductase n=1 Tax=Vitis vinifera TaxID=29760 RepID=A0A438E963_VITVI|nr:NADPH-dependent pterin aldehyde reductase [Vitis vinifera]
MKNKCGVPTLPPISTLHFEASHEAIFRNLRDEAHGAPLPQTVIWEVPEEEFDTVIDTNVKGTANVMRQFIPLMIENKQGIIVNMSSGWGRSAAAQISGKGVASGLAIVALNPGVINTDMLMSCFGGSAALYQTPEAWAPKAASMILNLTAADNGASLTV